MILKPDSEYRIMKFTIITINYNNVKGLKKTIDSVISQNFSDYEFIIIDGASTDGSVDIIKEYSPHISYWVSEPDKGIYHAMNKGITVSRGEYLLFLNSGDFFCNNKVLSDVLNHNLTEDIVCGATLDNGEIKYSLSDVTLQHFFSASMFHQSAFIKRELHLRYLYDEKLKICSDYKFFIQTIILNSCSYRTIDVVVSEYEGGGISQTSIALLEKEKNMILTELIPRRILRDYQMSYELDYRRLSMAIEKSRFMRIMYFINVFIIKLIKFFDTKHWIHKFPYLSNN